MYAVKKEDFLKLTHTQHETFGLNDLWQKNIVRGKNDYVDNYDKTL